MLKICKKLQEKRFVFVKIFAIIIPENGAKVSKIKCLRLNQQTLIISPYMPDIAANGIPVAFGDLSYFWILERQPLSVKILTELYARENQTGYAAYERIDGKLIRPEAVQLLKVK